MALLPPRVIGPLSECSGNVRVQGQLTGSTVTIFADGVAVGSGVASWSDHTFPISASLGVALVMEIWPNKSRALLSGLIGAAANVGFLLVALFALGLASFIQSAVCCNDTLGASGARCLSK